MLSQAPRWFQPRQFVVLLGVVPRTAVLRVDVLPVVLQVAVLLGVVPRTAVLRVDILPVVLQVAVLLGVVVVIYR